MTPIEIIHKDLCMLRDTQGTNAKIEALSNIHPHTVQVITWSFDPFHLFGISSIKNDFTSIDENVQDEDIITALQNSDYRWIRDNVESFSELQLYVTNQILGRFQGYQLKIGGKSFRKIYPDAYQTFGLQLAASYDPSKVEYPCYIQPKFDGVRCVVIVDDKGNVETLSRNGKPLYNIQPEIIEELSQFPGMIFDGEAITDGGDFNLSVGVIHRKNDNAIMSNLILFDVFNKSDLDKKTCTLHYGERHIRLSTLVEKTPVASREIVNSKEEAELKYKDYRAQGHEGAILKKIKGKYTFKRTSDWMKVKPIVEDEFEICGFKEGRGRLKGMLGAIFIKTQQGTKTQVGGGFSDEQRKYLWGIREELAGETVEVEYMEYTPAGRLRHPRFLKMRFDKGEM